LAHTILTVKAQSLVAVVIKSTSFTVSVSVNVGIRINLIRTEKKFIFLILNFVLKPIKSQRPPGNMGLPWLEVALQNLEDTQRWTLVHEEWALFLTLPPSFQVDLGATSSIFLGNRVLRLFVELSGGS